MKTVHVSSVAAREAQRRPKRGLGRVSKVLVAMGMLLTALTATQSTAVAADNEAKPASGNLVMGCSYPADGTYWTFTSNSDAHVVEAMDECLKTDGIVKVVRL